MGRERVSLSPQLTSKWEMLELASSKEDGLHKIKPRRYHVSQILDKIQIMLNTPGDSSTQQQLSLLPLPLSL